MISLDQMRDESPYVFVDGKKTDKNPFKDIRVRQALYQDIDIKTRVWQIPANKKLSTL